MKIRILITAVFAMAPAFLYSQNAGLEGIIAKDAPLRKLAAGFQFTEGPAAAPNGDVYFTDQPNDRIMVWSNKNGLSVFMEPSGRSNGLAFDSHGNLWSCADENTEILKITPDKKTETIINTWNKKRFNGPNDLWIAPDGGIYFTDPYYKRPWWSHAEMQQEKQRVYYLRPDLKTLVIVEEELLQPNGIVGTPDGKMLFVSDIRGNKTWSYSINPAGSLTDKKLFCDMGSDGMTIDTKGNIYLTGRGVTIFDSTGARIGNIEVPEKWTANVCFGDKNLKSLYITASNGFYKIKLKVKGTRG